MIDTNNPEIKFALDAVRSASNLVKTVQAEMVTPAQTKDDRSPVTVADYTAQALVGYYLAESYPKDAMIGEEDSSSLQTPDQRGVLERITSFVSRLIPHSTPELICEWIDRGSAETADRYWTLDPIDGTKGFLRGGQYAVALALVYDGVVQIGVLGCPQLSIGGSAGVLLVAARSQGTWLTPLDSPHPSRVPRFKQAAVSQKIEPSQVRLLRSFESGHTNVSQIDTFASELGAKAEPVRMDSQAKYAVLASGGGEIYLRLLSSTQPSYREKVWDQAAGSIVIEEAGGQVTDLDGKPLDFTRGRTLASNRGICATNGYLHQRALEVLAAIGA
jgi:3'(2'), 5'-bisphosphate nucleotidase